MQYAKIEIKNNSESRTIDQVDSTEGAFGRTTPGMPTQSLYDGVGMSHALRQLTQREMRVWRAFLGAHASVVSKLTAEMREQHDLPLTWYDVLVQLEEAGGTLRMHELADHLLLSRSATTRFVDRLESAGLIVRQACPSDRRGTFVALTDIGRDRLHEVAPDHLDGVARVFASQLNPAELDLLAEALEGLIDAPPPPEPC
jgi:DNA-binding MarR family transcriptional regulator